MCAACLPIIHGIQVVAIYVMNAAYGYSGLTNADKLQFRLQLFLELREYTQKYKKKRIYFNRLTSIVLLIHCFSP